MPKEPGKKKESEASHFEMLEARQSDRTASSENRHNPILDLSPREKQILGCSALGLTAKDTARYLVIEETTTRNHQAKIHQKMGANSVVSAFYEALRRGIITDEYLQNLEKAIIEWERKGRSS
jgi:DNA-binding NarL/FixJ family response regulator